MTIFNYGGIINEYLGTLEIEHIGDFAIEIEDTAGANFYLVARTSLGQTQIFEYGPIITDSKLLPSKVICKLSRIDFNTYILEKEIDKFLNNPRKVLVRASLIDIDEALDKCIDIVTYMKDFNEIERY